MVTNDVFDAADPQPFVLHQPARSEFVHLLDEVALEFLTFHVDTALDLKDYLEAREEYFTRPATVFYQGEHDLFLAYLAGSDNLGEPRKFPEIPEGMRPDGVLYQHRGIWDGFEGTEKYQVWQEESKGSVQWDRMIEHLITDLRSGHFSDQTGAGYAELEEMIRAFASTSRIERRQLMEYARAAGTDSRLSQDNTFRRMFTVGRDGTTAYLLLCSNPWPGEDAATYAERKNYMLFMHAWVIKLKLPHVTRVAALAFPGEGHQPFTWSPMLIDVRSLSPDEQIVAEECHAKGMFASELSIYHMDEFGSNPEVEVPPLVRRM